MKTFNNLLKNNKLKSNFCFAFNVFDEYNDK